MELIDVHAHLCDPSFDADRAAVLSRARQAGVARILCVGETLEDARTNLELAARHDELRACAGLYPTILDPAGAEEMIALIRENHGSLAAIGEVGLDRWKVEDEEGRAVQEEIFRRFIRLSLELDLPLNVHSRSAGRRALEVLEAEGARRVLMHAFDGKAAVAERGVALGCFFSIPPSVVRSRQKQKLAARLPKESVLLETDSPVLGPNPGERNEPSSIVVVVDYLAGAWGVACEEVARVTTANARRLFGDRI